MSKNFPLEGRMLRPSLSASSLSSAELKAAHQRRASLSASSLSSAELKAAHRLRQYYRMAAEGGQEQADAALGEARVQQQLRAAVATWFRRRAHPLRRAITRVSANTRRRIVDRLARRYIDSLHRWETWTRDAHQLLLAQTLLPPDAFEQHAQLGRGADHLLACGHAPLGISIIASYPDSQ
jgi:hypothetical protein